MNNQLGLCLASTARLEPIEEAFPIGSTTWHKGQAVTVVGHNSVDFAEPMIEVAFHDARPGTGILKRGELFGGPHWKPGDWRPVP